MPLIDFADFGDLSVFLHGLDVDQRTVDDPVELNSRPDIVGLDRSTPVASLLPSDDVLYHTRSIQLFQIILDSHLWLETVDS